MNKKSIIIIGCSFVLLTGCWDRIEIEDRGFVVGSAVDIIHHDETIESEVQIVPGTKGKILFMLTNQVVSPSSDPQSSQEGRISGKASYTDSAIGNTLFEAARVMATSNSRTPYYEHMEVLIFSEELAKSEKLPSVMDIFLRDHEMKRAVKVLISRGNAGELLKLRPEAGEMTTIHITSIINNYYKNAAILFERRLGDIHEFLLNYESFVLPMIKMEDDGIEISESAVINGSQKRMVGHLNNGETVGYNFLTNSVTGGYIKEKIKGDFVICEIKRASREIKADVTDPKHIKFIIEISTIGALAEKFARIDVGDQAIIETLENKFSAEVERLAQLAIDKLQQELKTDPLGFGDHIRQEHPKVWKKIKDHWDSGENLFAKCDIEVQANVQLTRGGMIIRSH